MKAVTSIASTPSKWPIMMPIAAAKATLDTVTVQSTRLDVAPLAAMTRQANVELAAPKMATKRTA
jgi:hypothetical protein